MNDATNDFRKNFFAQYKRWPGLIEVTSFNAMSVAANLVSSAKFSTRSEFENYIKGRSQISGLEGVWKNEEGVWVKEMSALRFNKNKVVSLFEENGAGPAENKQAKPQEENVL